MSDARSEGSLAIPSPAHSRGFGAVVRMTEQSQRGSNPCLHLERVVS